MRTVVEGERDPSLVCEMCLHPERPRDAARRYSSAGQRPNP
jgi:hypothetical protein